jgi:hypothetical protein
MQYTPSSVHLWHSGHHVQQGLAEHRRHSQPKQRRTRWSGVRAETVRKLSAQKDSCQCTCCRSARDGSLVCSLDSTGFSGFEAAVSRASAAGALTGVFLRGELSDHVGRLRSGAVENEAGDDGAGAKEDAVVGSPSRNTFSGSGCGSGSGVMISVCACCSSVEIGIISSSNRSSGPRVWPSKLPLGSRI